MEEKKFYATPRSGGVEAQQAPAVPAMIVAGWDPTDKLYHVLNLGCLVEPQILAEAAHTVDKVDSRNARVTASLSSSSGQGGAIGDKLTKEIAVPTGEVWFVNRFGVAGTAQQPNGRVKYNLQISPWPKTDITPKTYMDEDVVLPDADTDIYDLASPGELGAELRVVGGDKVTLVAVTTAAFTSGETQDCTLTLYGRKGKKIL